MPKHDKSNVLLGAKEGWKKFWPSIFFKKGGTLMKDGIIRVFVSQPMNGKTIEEIKEERERIVKAILSRCCAEYEIIDNITHDDEPDDVNGVWYLGKSIKLMYDADVVIFSRDYPTARGCLIEHDVAMKYNMTVCYELTDDVYSIGYGYEWS